MKHVRKTAAKAAPVARMDVATRALCFALRNPPKGQKKMALTDIKRMVVKTDGKKPTLDGINKAAQTFKQKKKIRGRRSGWRKTTKAEDKQVLKAFHKVRPPGHGVDSRKIHSALPKKVKKKIGKRTVRRRLAEKGLKPKTKLRNNDFSVTLLRKRKALGDKYLEWNAAAWKTDLQAVGDMKEFTWYPQDMRARFMELRAPWTYMTDAERHKPEFQRPKQWFPKKQWKRVKKQKVFGITTSNGRKLAFLVPKPWTSAAWAVEIKNRVIPFLKKAFPRKTSFQVLLDGEQLLHAPVAKAAMEAGNMSVFPGWPGYSPDINPQENVWSWAENELREVEEDDDSFEVFQGRLLKVVRAYPYAQKLVGGMANRMKLLVDKKGLNIGK